MKTFKFNIKSLYKSVWLLVALVPVLVLLTASVYGAKSAGTIVENSVGTSLFLSVLIPILSVYTLHSVTETEKSLIPAPRLLLCKFSAVNIFSVSLFLPTFAAIFVSGLIFSAAPRVLLNYIAFLLMQTLAQSIFLSSVSFFTASILKSKGAYLITLVFSIFFSEGIQILFEKNLSYEMNSFDTAVLNLLKIINDEPHRYPVWGAGMPFDSETILSFSAEILFALPLLCLCIFFEKNTRKKPLLFLPVISVTLTFVLTIAVNAYFFNAPVPINYSALEPKKIDFYKASEGSAKVTDYDLKLKLGNIFSLSGNMNVTNLNGKPLRIKLDEIFKLENLSVNSKDFTGKYERNGDYLILEQYPNTDILNISFSYSARLNYEDTLHHKTSYSDFTSAYLSHMFAWYPKILSAENESEKKFLLEITPNNTFVCNLNGAKLMPNEKAVLSGTAPDIYIFSGYIGETKINGKQVIMPDEFVKNERALKCAEKMINDILSHEEQVFYRYKYVLTKYDPELHHGSASGFEHDSELAYVSVEVPPAEIDKAEIFLYLPLSYNWSTRDFWVTTYITGDDSLSWYEIG